MAALAPMASISTTPVERSEETTFRAAVRSNAAAVETLITNASNTPAIETLYTYVNTADEGDPVVMERPLGEFPVLGS